MKDSATQLLGVDRRRQQRAGRPRARVQQGALSGKAGNETVVRDPGRPDAQVVHQTQPVSGAGTCDSRSTKRSSARPRPSLSGRCTRRGRPSRAPRRSSWIRAAVRFWPWPTCPWRPMPTMDKKKPAWDRNRAVTDVYEPGSIFKLVTVSGGTDRGTGDAAAGSGARRRCAWADRVIHEGRDARWRGRLLGHRTSSRSRATSAP